MFGKRKLEDLSVEDLEKALLVKKRQSRMARFERLSKEGYSATEALIGDTPATPPVAAHATPHASPPSKNEAPNSTNRKNKKRPKTLMDFMLLGLEVAALAGLVGVLVASYFNLRELNDEVSQAQQMTVKQQIAATPTPPPPIAVSLLPGGHSPPTAPGGAMPDVPAHLQRWVQPASSAAHVAAGAIEVAPQNSTPPTRIVIPKINVDAPIVDGVNWNDLKKGVGHLSGSANPGERGNMYLAAHNDIYGEIFRYLEELEPGDEYTIYAGEEKFRYVVKEQRIIDPTDVEVMLPTTKPVSTLQTCYPYLVDTHRLVVIGELAE